MFYVQKVLCFFSCVNNVSHFTVVMNIWFFLNGIRFVWIHFGKIGMFCLVFSYWKCLRISYIITYRSIINFLYIWRRKYIYSLYFYTWQCRFGYLLYDHETKDSAVTACVSVILHRCVLAVNFVLYCVGDPTKYRRTDQC